MRVIAARPGSSAVLAVAALTLGTLVAGTAVVSAAPQDRKVGVSEQGVERQQIVWRTGKANRVYTNTATWQPLPMPDGGCKIGGTTCTGGTAIVLPARGEISLTFSGNFSRAPLDLRVRDDGQIMKPGRVNFRPGRGTRSFTYTFVSPRKGERRLCGGIQFEWRSPTGRAVRLNKATVVVQFKRDKAAESVDCT